MPGLPAGHGSDLMLQELKEARRAGAQTLTEADDIVGELQALQPPVANGHAAALAVPIPALTPLHLPAASAAVSSRSTGRLGVLPDASLTTPAGSAAVLQVGAVQCCMRHHVSLVPVVIHLLLLLLCCNVGRA